MDLKTLNDVAKFAEILGFESKIYDENSARFIKRGSGYIVEVCYGKVPELRYERVYIATSANSFDNVDVTKEFAKDVEDATQIFEKLEELK